MLGATILLLLYLFVVGRALYLAVETQDTFARLLAGSIALTFFVYVFINAGMVSGLLPVVGVPLPLVSYGGTSMVTLLAGFGILMSLYSHRKLIALVTRRIADIWIVALLFFSGTAYADGSFSGHTRFDLDRADIQEFVNATAAAQKMQPLDVYRLLAKAEPQPKIIEADQQARGKGVAVVGVPRALPHRTTRHRRRAVHAGTSRAPRKGAPGYRRLARIRGGHHRRGDLLRPHHRQVPRARRAGDPRLRLSAARRILPQRAGAVHRCCREEEQVDPLTALGSYAGAMGASQFMPSSYRRYAVDGGNDQQRDLFADWDDIIASVANYFKAHGWVADGPVLADAVLQPDAPVVADPGNLSLNETVAGLKAKGVDFDPAAQDDSTPVLLVPAETAARAFLSRRLQEFRRDHALQPQRPLRHGGARSRDRPSQDAWRWPMRRETRRRRSSPRASLPKTTIPPRAEAVGAMTGAMHFPRGAVKSRP